MQEYLKPLIGPLTSSLAIPNKHKNAVKKENKYDAGILKTSDRSTNIIFSYPQ